MTFMGALVHNELQGFTKQCIMAEGSTTQTLCGRTVADPQPTELADVTCWVCLGRLQDLLRTRAREAQADADQYRRFAEHADAHAAVLTQEAKTVGQRAEELGGGKTCARH